MNDVTAPGRVRIARRCAVAVAGMLVTASCAAGQQAQTADISSTIDGTSGRIGTISLQGVAIHAPGGSSYATGSNAQLAVTLINTGNSADTLVNVASPAFAGWGIVDNASAGSVTTKSGADTGLTVNAGSAQRLGIADLGAAASASPRTVVLMSLANSAAPLFPGSAVDVTFRFANAGTTTLHVPVQLTTSPNGATLPAPSGSPSAG